MKLIVHGARGSHPMPKKNYMEFGGNTSCVEVMDSQNKERLFLDAGTGLGFAGIMMAGEKKAVINILLSHLHPDHIFSLPYFMPLSVPGNKVNIWTTKNYSDNYLEKTGKLIDGDFVMIYPYYPIPPEEFHSVPEFFLINKEKINIGGYTVEHKLMKHYEGSVAYKISSGGKTFVYASDVADIATRAPETAEFCRGAHLLVWDSLYTPDQINETTKYKHTAIDSVIALAKIAGIPKVAHFHHSPFNDDKALEKLEKIAQEIAGSEVQSFFAREGMEIEL